MDILAARKKAAEKARSRKEAETRALSPAPDAVRPAEPAVQPPAPETPPEPAPVQESPAVEAAVAAAEEAAEAGGAGEGDGEEAPVQEIEMLSFRLGGEAYAVAVEDVREVLKPRELTMVPNAPAYILGIMSLRGTMLPVVDLCARLGIAAGVRDEKVRIIVVSPGEEEAGLLVDRVTGVFRITEDAVKPPPEHLEHGSEFLRGIARRGDTLYILLDLIKALGA